MKTRTSPRPPCIGSANVIPVPPDMTAEQVWDEITTLGRLRRTPADDGLGWACFKCPGGDDCRCRFIDRSTNWRRYRNDVLVEAKVLGRRVPRWLLPLLRAWEGPR